MINNIQIEMNRKIMNLLLGIDNKFKIFTKMNYGEKHPENVAPKTRRVFREFRSFIVPIMESIKRDTKYQLKHKA